MRSWVAAGVLVLALGSSLYGCVDRDDFACMLDCRGQTYLRLDPPLDLPGTYALTVETDRGKVTCTVWVPLLASISYCSGSSELEVWASDDDSNDFAGITLFQHPESVQVEISWERELLVLQTADVTVRREGGECACTVGRATIPSRL